MVIDKYTDNLYASEVYRELERQAVRKGHFEPTDEERVKLAAQQVNQTLEENKFASTEQTDDLIQDIARLAYAMRRKGYTNHAEELEQKLLLYKQAESSLYNVTPETNKDFIGFSHRDGDVEIIEGSGELGTIETIESLAKKIRAITEKEPSGKLPGKSASLEELAGFIKQAVEEEFAKTYRMVDEKIDAFPNIRGLNLTFAGQNFVDNAAARKLYATVAGKSESAVQKAADMYRKMLAKGFKNIDHAEFLNLIRSNMNNAEPVREIARMLGVEINSMSGVRGYRAGSMSGQFFTDTSKATDTSQLAKLNPASIWVQVVRVWNRGDQMGYNHVSWGMDEQAASAYAEKLRSTYYSRFSDPAYGAYFADLKKANAKIAKAPEDFANAIAGAKILPNRDPGNVKDPDTQVVNMSLALKPLYDSQRAVNTAVRGDIGKWALAGLRALNHQDKAAAVDTWYKEITSTTYPSAQKAVSGQTADMVDISPAVGKMTQAIKLWREAAALVPRDADVQSNAKANISAIRGVLSAIQGVGLEDSNSKPRGQLLDEALKPNDYASFDELVTDLDTVVAQATADRDKSKELAGK